jgi:hypothetical protein
MKWIDELKVRFTHTDNIDKNVFSWLLVLVSVVLKKNDNGEGMIGKIVKVMFGDKRYVYISLPWIMMLK